MRNHSISSRSSNFKYFESKNGIIVKQNGEEALLEQRLKYLFATLFENQDKYVRRSELIDNVWKEVVVHEQSLTKAISDLRKFFKSHEINNIQIVTANKLGYKMIISKSNNKTIPTNMKLIQLSKIAGYSMLAILVIIILIRAASY